YLHLYLKITSNLYCVTIVIFLDFERGDECIDFIMMCVITSRNNASISNFGCSFRWKKEYPWCTIEVKTFSNSIQKNGEKQKKKKNDGKTGIFTQNQFSTKSIFYMVVIQKLIIFKFFRKRENLQFLIRIHWHNFFFYHLNFELRVENAIKT
ncbi:Uncharacterized protein FWK35_00000210, partial [Aphis craccivora]